MLKIRQMTADDYDGVNQLWQHTPGMGLNAIKNRLIKTVQPIGEVLWTSPMGLSTRARRFGCSYE